MPAIKQLKERGASQIKTQLLIQNDKKQKLCYKASITTFNIKRGIGWAKIDWTTTVFI